MSKKIFYMSKINILLYFSILTVLTISNGCYNKNHQIIPNEFDTADVYEPLSPNEDENPEEPTFGQEHIPGLMMSERIPGNNDDIYIDLNLTFLVSNPEIIYNIFNFITSELQETGFINEKDFSSFPSLDLSEDSLPHLEKYVSDCLDSIRILFTKQLPEIESYKVPFNITIDAYPVFLNDDYVTYRKYAYYYTGGAHGNSESLLTTFNLTNGKPIGLKNIVKSDRLDDIREMVASHMAYSYPIYDNIKTVDEYIDSLNVWLGTGTSENENAGDRITLKNYPLKDPAITQLGLVFIYEKYELAPGVDGSPVVVLPYLEIRDCLKAPFNEY